MLPKRSSPRGVALAGKSHRQESRSPAIQPMQRARVGVTPSHPYQVRPQATQNAVIAGVAVGGNAQQSGRLVDHDKILILVRDGKREADRRFAAAIRLVRHALRQ